MPNLSVAVLGPIGFSKDMAKKGTSTDITLYDVKRGEDTVSFVEPTRYPERLASLFYACSMADSALVVVEEVNAQFGECVLMLDALGIRCGRIILRNFIDPDKVAPLIKGTVLERYSYEQEDYVALRELFLDEASRKAIEPSSSKGSVAIDHFFNVKGVGTVVLGHVAMGTIRKYSDLTALPARRSALVRSIQKHDDDFEIATKGDRVGLALKGVDAEELDRGYVLTDQHEIKCEDKVIADASLSKYWPAPLKEGMVVHVGHWMQFLPARVTVVDNGADWRRPSLELVLQKELVHLPGALGTLCYLDGGKLRVAGTIRLP